MAEPVKNWTPNTWRSRPIKQVPDYPDTAALATVEARLKTYPPLVFAGEARNLKASLGQVADGKAFLLQGGDCAESFAEFHPDNIRDTFRVILQMAVVLTFAGALPVVKVGRIAGQFAKPRSERHRDPERRHAAVLSRRQHQRHRVRRGRPHARSGAADAGLRPVGGDAQPASRLRDRRLRRPAQCPPLDAGFHRRLAVERTLPRARPTHLRIARPSWRPAASRRNCVPQLRSTDFYTSHEALLLGYEQAMTRVDSTSGDWYCTSAHMVWIGDRTRAADGAHVEFAAASRTRSGSNADRASPKTTCCA